MKRRCPLLRPFAVLALLSDALSAQSPRGGVVVVGVADGRTGAPIANADVHVSGVGRGARTDWLGRAEFGALGRGVRQVSVRALGYEPLSAPVLVKDGPADTVEAVLFLERMMTTLDTVIVVERAAPARLREFEARRQLAFGQYLTSEELDREWNRTLADVLAIRFSGLRSSLDSTGTLRLYSTRSTGLVLDTFPSRCPIDVYFDGLYAQDGDVDLPPPTWIAAVEYYTKTAAPPQYRRAGVACGVLLVWLK